MSRLFITILNMSYTASIVILAVLLLRFFLKQAPRVFSYALWMVVLLRLLCPFSINANWGIIPAEKLVEIGTDTNLWVWENGGNQMGGLEKIHNVFRLYAPEGATEGENIDYVRHDGEEYSLQKINRFFLAMGRVWMKLGKIWAVGAILLVLYGGISYHILAVRLKKISQNRAQKVGQEDDGFTIVISDEIKTPFVAGAGLMKFVLIAVPVKPIIYLPEGLDETQQNLILEHEKIHIRRRDYLIKPIAYLAVCLHWFNPLVWVAFHFMEQDMEISCDEAVLKKVGYEKNKEYARTLLAFSGENVPKPGYPIAFGESSVKTRIKEAVKLKKAKKWVIVTAFMGVLAAAVLLLVNGNFRQQEPSVAAEDAKAAGQDGNKEGGVRGTDVNEEIVYLPTEHITVKETASETQETTVTMDHYYSEDTDFTYKGMDALSTMKSAVAELVEKYETFGLSAEIYENDYQLYYNGEPIRFFADNKNGGDPDKFSGTVFSRPASEQNGYTGVMTQYDESGRVVGLIGVSEEELNAMFGNN